MSKLRRTVAGLVHSSRNDEIARMVVAGGATSVAVRIVGILLSYATNVLLSRVLGLTNYAHYVIALSWAFLFVLPAKAGCDNSALRFPTIYMESGNYAALRGFIGFAAATICSTSLILGVIMVVGGRALMPAEPWIPVWAALLVLTLAIMQLFAVLMRTARRIAASQFYEQVLRPTLLIVVLVVAVWVAGVKLDATKALFFTVLAAAIALAALIMHFRLVLGPMLSVRPSYSLWRKWLAVSVPMLVMGVVQESLNQIDIIMLGHLADEKQAALFAASWRLASLVPFALVALSTMAGPLIASAHERQVSEELRRVASLVARLGFAFACVASLALFLLGPFLLSLYGPEFVAGTPVLRILLLGALVNAFTGVVGYFLTMTGNERAALKIYLSALAISIGLNLVLIPVAGAVGSAVASGTALAFWNIVMLIYVRRKFGIDTSIFGSPVRQAGTH